MIALIPARSGSKRIPGKNTKPFFGHPLIAYTIQTALASKVFDAVWVCTDSDETGQFALHMGASFWKRDEVPDEQPDIVWVSDLLGHLTALDRRPNDFAILRPTSPFRTTEMLQQAYRRFYAYLSADSLRAVEPVKQHPGKMWTWAGRGYPIQPLLSNKLDGVPWHSSPTQSLPIYYVQNASLEMAWTRNVEVYGTIHGRDVVPFFCDGYTGFDLNTPADWREAEYLVASGAAVLPEIPVSAVSETPWAV